MILQSFLNEAGSIFILATVVNALLSLEYCIVATIIEQVFKSGN